jgi:hypothetical protein
MISNTGNFGQIGDLFSVDGFSVTTLTSYLERFPYYPTFLEQVGIFQNVPIPTTSAAVEVLDGRLTLLPTTARGGKGIAVDRSERKVRQIDLPHLDQEIGVTATDLQNVRAPGSTVAQIDAATRINMDLRQMAMNVRLFWEMQRIGAVTGKITYPTGSVAENVDLFELFDQTQTSVDFDLTNSSSLILQDKMQQVRLAMIAAMGTSGFSRIMVLCSPGFYKNLLSNANFLDSYKTFREVYKNNIVMEDREEAGPSGGGLKTMLQEVSIQGFTFVEYFDNNWGFIDDSGDGTAKAFPLSADGTFIQYNGPTDYVSEAGAAGLPMVAAQYMDQSRKFYHVETQSNTLFICQRPKALIALKA